MRRERLIARRRDLGESQSAIAHAAGVDRTTYARWEYGGAIAPWNRRPLARALEISLADLDDLMGNGPEAAENSGDMASARQQGQSHDGPVNRRQFITGFAATAAASTAIPGPRPRIGAADVAALRSEVAGLLELDDRYGGATLYSRALAAAEHVRTLLDRSHYGPGVGSDLQLVAGELTEMAGWLAFDAGLHDRARALWTDALYRARLADDDHLTIAVMASMCLQALRRGHNREALDLAKAAQRISRPFASPRLLSVLTAREARAHAQLGDSGRCAAALHRSEQLLDRGHHDTDADADADAWTAFWGPADFHHAVAASHLALNAPDDAAQANRTALDAVDGAYPRNRALYLAHLAQTVSTQGDVDEAAALGTDALRAMPSVSSGRLRDDLMALGDQLRPQAQHPGVADYLFRLDMTLASR